MEFGRFKEIVSEILETRLPRGHDIVKQGRDIAGEIEMGVSAFAKSMGVQSEAEYKRICIKENKIMYHAHIGFNSWEETSRGLKELDFQMRSLGYIQDRAGICLDRRMGLPENLRSSAPAETGPLLESLTDWLDIGQAALIQPHMGDFMIGFPSSTSNAVNALKAGVTTIGNLSQFFSHEAPGWKDVAYTTVETVKAIAVIGAFRDQGSLLHSYLDDGYGALFFDCATVAGWALLEKYVVEDLLGAKIAHCMGGLICEVVRRSGWVFALDKIHDHDCIGSMFFGDTISFGTNFDKNRALVAEYLMWDIMTQLECPTGHAMLAMPVTEAVRIPSLEEIVEIQVFARRIEQAARRMKDLFNFTPPRDFAEKVYRAGKEVFSNAMSGLKEAGVDVKDPVQILYTLKKIGPALFEEMFGAGKLDESYPRGHVPVVPNDVFEESERRVCQERKYFANSDIRNTLFGKRFLLASTDVHEHALYVIGRILRDAGGIVLDLGAEKNPDEVADACLKNNPQALLISTHNGMALEYAKILLEEMVERDIDIPVVFGGVLNQKTDNSTMPVDVDEQLADLGIFPTRTTEELAKRLLSLWK